MFMYMWLWLWNELNLNLNWIGSNGMQLWNLILTLVLKFIWVWLEFDLNWNLDLKLNLNLNWLEFKLEFEFELNWVQTWYLSLKFEFECWNLKLACWIRRSWWPVGDIDFSLGSRVGNYAARCTYAFAFDTRYFLSEHCVVLIRRFLIQR